METQETIMTQQLIILIMKRFLINRKAKKGRMLTVRSLRTLSTASSLAQMKTSRGRSSRAELCSSFSTYGKIPTDNACTVNIRYLRDNIYLSICHFRNIKDTRQQLASVQNAYRNWKWLSMTFQDLFMRIFEDFPGPFMSISMSFKDCLIDWILNMSDFHVTLNM